MPDNVDGMPDNVDGSRQRNLTYAEAVNAALSRALEEIPETLLFGEDVGVPGGVFGVTKGLAKKFGNRVFDTPISESAILGGAVGAAMVGRRPIVELMWIDFSLVAMDQIVNQAANARYVTRGELSAPLTIRTQSGSAPGACAQHSQSLEAFFAHVPGLQVAVPATGQDAYDLLLTAIHSDDPTIVIENRTLYHLGKQPVTVDGPVEAMGQAAIRRPGSDVTVVTWGAIQARVLEAAEVAALVGVEAEVIDLRWLRPYDLTTVLESVQRTRRLLVVHEAHTIGGFGAEVISAVTEAGVPLLAPPSRVGAPPVRIPAAPALMNAVIPNLDRISDAIIKVVRGDSPDGAEASLAASTAADA
jgi:acetoin:2,6-dichlorophenolindophenol oxidoreductase subunit beta